MNTQVMAARKQRGLTQAALAKKVKVYRTGIALIEIHGWVPPADMRERIAKVLNQPEGVLFGEALRGLRG